jgi:hypothetical protein
MTGPPALDMMRTSAKAGTAAMTLKTMAKMKRCTATSDLPLASFVTRKTAEMQHAHAGFNERHRHHAEAVYLRERFQEFVRTFR